MSSSIVLVTGASRGIGLAIAQSLLKQGASVLGVGRSTLESLPALQQLASEYPDRFAYCVADLSVQGSAKTAIDACVARFGSIHSLVHNAGILEPIKKIADCSISEWRTLMEVNLFAGIELVQLALPMLRNGGPSGNGRILIVSSGAAVKAYRGWGPYCVSKAAVNMLVSGLAVEEPSVTSIALRPGVVDTGMQSTIRDSGAEAMGANHSDFVALKESGKLLDASAPGTAAADLALRAPQSLSGEFINWNDARVASLRQ